MIGLPESTKLNTRVPKQTFYEHIEVNQALKRAFTDQIRTIHWRYKIATTTTNLLPGKIVEEIEILEIKLRGETFDEEILRQIDRAVPYHILFIVEYGGKYQAWISYKEPTAGKSAFKVGEYYHTSWLEEKELPLKLTGLTLDDVYEHYVYAISGGELQKKTEEESLKETVERDKKRRALEKEIKALENKIRKEKQLNKQMEMNSELKALKRERETLK